MSLYRNEAPETCYGCKALALRIEAVERERDALLALLTDIREAGRITGDIAVRLIAALQEKK